MLPPVLTQGSKQFLTSGASRDGSQVESLYMLDSSVWTYPLREVVRSSLTTSL